MRKSLWPVLCCVALAVVYSLTTPLFEAPDEVWHYAYIRYLAERKALPPLTGDRGGAYQEVAQPPLYYAAAALVSGLVPDDDLPELMWHNPGFGYQAEPTVNDNKNMLIHTDRERFPWRGAVLAVRLARLISIAFGTLTVWAAWGLGREALPTRPGLALSVAAIVAFNPQFLFICGVVSNDGAAAALATAALWAMARLVNRGMTVWRSVGLGLILGLATLTKTSTLPLIPLAAVAYILSCRKSRRARRTMGYALLTFTISGAVGGWWYLRNALSYRDPLAVRVHLDTPWGRAEPASFFTLLAELPQIYRSFWGGFGWGHVQYPDGIYIGLGMMVLVAVVGWVMAWRRILHRGSRLVFLIVGLWTLIVCAALFQWMRHVEAPHGRLLFPAIGAIALFLVGGWAALSPRLALGFPAFLLLLALLTPPLVIHPAFVPPRLLPPAEAAATVESGSLIFGGEARLLGIALKSRSVSPGETLVLRACWEALTPMERDYTVFIHLIGKGNIRVAERYTYPGLGRFPTSLWPVGQAFCDIYHVPVERWATTPELYDLLIGLLDKSTGERLTVYDREGNPIEYPVLARIRVAPERPLALPEGVHRLDYHLGEGIALVGYRISDPVRSGAPLTVTLYWRAEEPITENYTVFVHLLKADSAGPLLTQHDGPPRYGRYPTSAWQIGDLVPDEHILAVPALADGSEMCLAVGMYQPNTMERLPVIGPEGHEPDSQVSLPLR